MRYVNITVTCLPDEAIQSFLGKLEKRGVQINRSNGKLHSVSIVTDAELDTLADWIVKLASNYGATIVPDQLRLRSFIKASH